MAILDFIKGLTRQPREIAANVGIMADILKTGGDKKKLKELEKAYSTKTDLPFLLKDEEQPYLKEGDIRKSAAGTAAFLVPAGQGVGGMALSGLASGALGGYGASKKGEELQSTATGGLVGAGTGAALGAVGELIKKLKPATTKVGENIAKKGQSIQEGTITPGISRARSAGSLQEQATLPKQFSDVMIDSGLDPYGDPIKVSKDVTNLRNTLLKQKKDIINTYSGISPKVNTGKISNNLMPEGFAVDMLDDAQVKLFNNVKKNLMGGKIEIGLDDAIRAERYMSKFKSDPVYSAALRNPESFEGALYAQLKSLESNLVQDPKIAEALFDINNKVPVLKRAEDMLKRKASESTASTLQGAVKKAAYGLPGEALDMVVPAGQRADMASKFGGKLQGLGNLIATAGKSQKGMTVNPLIGKIASLGATQMVTQPSAPTRPTQQAQITQPTVGNEEARQQLIMQLIASGKVKSINEAIALTNALIPKETKKSAAASKDIQNAQSALSDISMLEQGVPLTSVLPFGGFTSEGQIYQRASSNIADVLSRLRTGATINADEEKLYRGYIPSVMDTPEARQYKLNQLKTFFEGLASQ